MKKSLIIPTPEMSNTRPLLDRTMLMIELDYERCIAGEAFSTTPLRISHANPATIVVTRPVSWLRVD